MSTITKLISTIALVTLTINLLGQNVADHKPKIEIYLIGKHTKADSSQPQNNYFLPTKEDLSDSVFIKDDEILGYRFHTDTSQQSSRKLYSILLTTSGQQKITNLQNIPLCCGKRFAVTVDGQPVFGAYFWNLVSSFGCTWLSTFAKRDGELKLVKGIPEFNFDNTKEDPRNDTNLINAFKVTGRLLLK